MITGDCLNCIFDCPLLFPDNNAIVASPTRFVLCQMDENNEINKTLSDNIASLCLRLKVLAAKLMNRANIDWHSNNAHDESNAHKQCQLNHDCEPITLYTS